MLAASLNSILFVCYLRHLQNVTSLNNILLVFLLVCYLGDYYRKLEQTIYFPSNGSFTVGYHSFPHGFTTFLSTHNQHSVAVQHAINANCFHTKLLYFGNFITAAKTCTSIITHFKFLLGNSMLAMLCIKVSYSQKLSTSLLASTNYQWLTTLVDFYGHVGTTTLTSLPFHVSYS